MTTQRRISLLAATGIGVGSMIGAGVFSDLWVDVLAAGDWYLVAIVTAAAVALANALSTAQLAARYPVAGGAYAYGRAELGELPGHIAGAAFVVGKTVSVAVGAVVLGAYVLPGHASVVGTAAIALAWALNSRGITRTALGATVIAVVVVAALGALVWMSLATGPTVSWVPATAPLVAVEEAGGAWMPPFLVAVAATFFAFAGYARIATLGEEVADPARTIPRAVVGALAIVVVVYLAVGFALHSVFAPPQFPGEDVDWPVNPEFARAPLEALADAAGMPVWIVTVVAALSVGGAMLAVMAGAGRTAMAMAREGDLPRALAMPNSSGAPWRAEGLVAIAAIALVWTEGASLVLVSAASVLTYYAVANIAAAQQRRAGRTASLRLPIVVPVAGLLSSAVLAVVALVSAGDAWWPTMMLLALVLGWPLVWAMVKARRARS